MTRIHKAKRGEPSLTRSDVAQILNVTPLTIANREKRKQYPSPQRDLNGYRRYSLNDVFNLQIITYNQIDTKPILSVLYDKGFTDPKLLGGLIDSALNARGAIS